MEIACITSVAAAKPNVNTSAAHFAVVISLSTILARWKLEKALLYKAAQLKTLLVKRRDGCTVLPRDLWQCFHFNGAKGNNGRQRRSSGATEVPRMCPYEAAIPPRTPRTSSHAHLLYSHTTERNVHNNVHTCQTELTFAHTSAALTNDRKRCSQCPHTCQKDEHSPLNTFHCVYIGKRETFAVSTHAKRKGTSQA